MSAGLPPFFLSYIYTTFLPDIFNDVRFVINTHIPDHCRYGAASFDILPNVHVSNYDCFWTLICQ